MVWIIISDQMVFVEIGVGYDKMSIASCKGVER